MKKLVTMLAALATGFFAFGESAVPSVKDDIQSKEVGASFVGYDAEGKFITESGRGAINWWSDDPGLLDQENYEAPATVAEDPADSSKKVLNVESDANNALLRTFSNVTESSTPGTYEYAPVTIENHGLFIDTKVKFTPSAEAPQATDDSKLIVWALEIEADDTVEAATNLMVTCGFVNGDGDLVPTNYTLKANFDASKFYQLTIRADVDDADDTTKFRVFLDRVELKIANTEFLSLQPLQTLAKVAYVGTGSVKSVDLLNSTDAAAATAVPFAVDPTKLTIAWTKGVTGFEIGGELHEVTAEAGSMLLDVPAGKVTVKPVYETSPAYELKEFSSDDYKVTEEEDGSGSVTVPLYYIAGTLKITAKQSRQGAQLWINEEQVGEDFAFVKDVVDYIVAEGLEGETLTIKLLLNEETDNFGDWSKLADATLDLNGKTITAVAPWTGAAYDGSGEWGPAVVCCGKGNTLTIKDSVGGGRINGIGDDVAAFANCGDSYIEASADSTKPITFNGAVYSLLDKATGFSGTLSIDGGRFLTAIEYAGVEIPEDYEWVGPDSDGFYTIAPIQATPFAIIIAGEPVYFNTLEAAIAAAGTTVDDVTYPTTVTLMDNCSVTARVNIDKAVTIDLNGNTITYSAEELYNSGVFGVKFGGDLTIDDSSEDADGVIDGTMCYAAVAMTIKNEVYDGTPAKLTVKAGTLKGFYYGIVGSGNAGRGHTAIVIDGGLVEGLNTDDSLGIYNPQGDSTIVVNGGTVKGATGIYAKAGEITVNGGKIIATGAAKDPAYNGNGAEPTGDAIVLDSTTTYAGKIKLTLDDDAEVSSANGYAVRETITQGNKTATLEVNDAGAALAGKLGGLKVSDKFAEAVASGAAKITGYVAAVNGLCYASFKAAFDAAQSGNTITLLANITDATGLTTNGKGATFELTIDFNGKTYTVNKPGAGSTGTAKAAFQFMKGQTIVLKNGTMQAAADNLVEAPASAKNIYRFIQNYADLTLEDMTFDATNLYIDQNHAADYFPSAVEVCYGTVSIAGATSINDKDGMVSLTVDTYKQAGGAYKAGADVTINTTGTIASILCYSEGPYAGEDQQPSDLDLEAGTIGSIAMAGGEDVVVTKAPAVDLAAPEGYVWGNDGTLAKITLPTADVEALDVAELGLATGVTFTAANQGAGYDDWQAKFILKSNVAIGEDEIALYGQYDEYAWTAIEFPGCEAGEEIDVLALAAGDPRYENITVNDVFTLIQQFNCAISNIALKADASFDLSLIITDGETTNELCSVTGLSVAQSEPEETGFAVIIAGTTTTNGYDTLAKAIEAANAGDTVAVLKADQTNDAAITIDKAITLDLGGFTLASTAGFTVNADLTVQNGSMTINCSGNAFLIPSDKNVIFTIADGVILAGYAAGNEYIKFQGSGELNFNGMYTADSGKEIFAIALRNDNIVANMNGNITTAASAIKMNNAATVNIIGGVYTSTSKPNPPIFVHNDEETDVVALNITGGKFVSPAGSFKVDNVETFSKLTAENCKALFSNKLGYGESYNGQKLADFVADGYGIKEVVIDEATWYQIAPAYDITFAEQIDNGTLETSVTNNIVAGDSVTVYATPADGFAIDKVYINGVELEAVENVYSFEMPAEDVTVSATFKANGPTDDDGGEVVKEGDDYVVIPDDEATEVSIKNLPPDFTGKVIVPATVATIKGVPTANIAVKNSAGTIIPTGVFVGGDATTGFSTALDGTKSVDVAGETIKVQPEIAATENDGDTDATPLAVGSNVAVGVKSIPGLTYTLKRADELGTGFVALTTDGASLTAGAEQTRVELKDIAKPTTKAFYVIGVEIK